jgi:GntR family transcriptional repressor for pyruvate dehydrogenase complex
MSYPQVKPRKGSDIVKDHLLEQIVSGHYALGSKMPTVVELAEGFEVGRSTIREALSALKAMGLVEIKHGGGTFVCKELPHSLDAKETTDLFKDTKSYKEVLEVRKFIESGCAELAALRRTEQDLIAIEHALLKMKEALGNEEQSEQADVDFHLRIAEASHNSLLIPMMVSLTERLQVSMSDSRRLWFFAEPASADRLLEEHTAIYEAIRDQDGTLAGERMAAHIRKVDTVLQRLT